MSPERVTTFSWVAVYVLLFSLLVVGVLDLWLIRYQPDGPTVSSTIWGLAKQYPIIVLLVGILLGHLFFPQHG